MKEELEAQRADELKKLMIQKMLTLKVKKLRSKKSTEIQLPADVHLASNQSAALGK